MTQSPVLPISPQVILTDVDGTFATTVIPNLSGMLCYRAQVAFNAGLPVRIAIPHRGWVTITRA